MGKSYRPEVGEFHFAKKGPQVFTPAPRPPAAGPAMDSAEFMEKVDAALLERLGVPQSVE